MLQSSYGRKGEREVCQIHWIFSFFGGLKLLKMAENVVGDSCPPGMVHKHARIICLWGEAARFRDNIMLCGGGDFSFHMGNEHTTHRLDREQ